MSSENNNAKESQLDEKPVEGELASEQLSEVVGGAGNYYLNFPSPTNQSHTNEVNSFNTGTSNPNTHG